MMTVFEFQARVLERSAASLAFWAQTTAADKLTWKPELEGSCTTRSVLEQIQECVGLNKMLTATLKGEAPAPPPAEAPAWTLELANQMLIESAGELATVVRNMDETAFNKEYTLPFAKMDGAVMLHLAAMNMSYHGGQINLIQMLCGDGEFHVPAGFTKF